MPKNANPYNIANAFKNSILNDTEDDDGDDNDSNEESPVHPYDFSTVKV